MIGTKLWTSALGQIHSSTVMARRIPRLASHLVEFFPENVCVLDVGSGDGQLASLIMEKRPDIRIEGLDVLLWPEQAIETSQFDGHSIPFSDGEWDFCMACDVLHHCEDPVELLSEMTRVAKLGIVLKDHLSNSPIDHFTLCLMDWVGNRGHGVELPFNYYSSVEWNEAIESVGLHLDMTVNRLKLYPHPFSWFFDRDLHFVSRYRKSEYQTKD